MVQRAPANIISNWYYLLEDFQTSAQDFYKSVEAAIQKREIPDIKIERIDYKEGGMFSAKREYLRIRRKEYIYDICAAPFGKGFFFSWWLGETPSGCLAFLMGIPFLNLMVDWVAAPVTYFKIDTAHMFQESVRAAVNEVIDELTKAKGVRQMTELERKPISRDFFQG